MRASDDFVMIGRTEFAHEQAGLDFVRERLPAGLHARALLELFEPSSGRRYEIDLVVIGHSAVYVVELKDYEGRIAGDEHVWELTRPGAARPVIRDNPLAVTNLKCKVLRSQLDEYFRRHHPKLRVPFVQPLVFLTNERVEPHLSPAGNTAVVTRSNVIAALQHGKYPGAKPRDAIDGPTFAALRKAFDAIGLRPRPTQQMVAHYRLGAVLGEGPGYQDREAQHESIETMRARARIYLVPQHTSVEERDRLRRAAKRESQLLVSVQAPDILRVLDFVDDAPLGPTLLLEDFPGGMPLDRFLEREALSFDERVEVFRRIGLALALCHRREVAHGGLHPGAVLVRRHEGSLDIKLFDFQLGAGREASLTLHRTLLASESAQVYQAPELVRDPRAVSPSTDCFSLGALGHLLFTGRPPASDLAGAQARLRRERCFDPAVTSDEVPLAVAETIRCATSNDNRIDDAALLVENLVVDLERASDTSKDSTAHVLVAKDGDILAERFEVTKVLGYGASARVLRVRDGHDGRDYALKVARDGEHNEHLRHEGAALDKLGHPRIVRKLELDEIDGLVYLQLSLAGEQTLHEQIAAEGGLNYDMALRYGEDLLEALEHCEDKGLLHRDIKPANLGVGSLTSKSNHLTLFDFSLADLPQDRLDVGTPSYRDPHLWERGRWDAAADRWSAAVTLHEMLTGVRAVVRESGEPQLAAERFDSGVRAGLIEFFARAFAPGVDARFDSARAMKRAWSAALLGIQRAPQAEIKPSREPLVEPTQRPSDAEVAKITRRTPISALPLSSRAVNALDRAGLSHAEELLSLPNNRLSAIRGIGSKVAGEILELRDRWRAMLSDRETPPPELFLPHYRGPDQYLDTLGLDRVLAQALDDAGLLTTTTLARTPSAQIDALLLRIEVPPDELRERLRALESSAGEVAAPATLEAWIDALAIGGKKAAELRMRRLFGLEPPQLGRLDVSLRELEPIARRDYAEAIKRWRAQPWASALLELTHATLAQLTGVAPLPLAAAALRATIPHDASTPEPLVLARCGALLRVAVELAADDAHRHLAMHRRTRGLPGHERPVLWLVNRPDLWLSIDNLGRVADELAKRPVLAASNETERALELVVQNTALSVRELGLARLVELAAWASRHAAASSRLELYPLGMPAARALELSVQALGKQLAEQELVRRVQSRYPEALELPGRPALDRLLEPLQLHWVEGEGDAPGSYQRPQPPSPTTSLTDSLGRLPTQAGVAVLPLPLRREAEFVAEEFEHDLRALVEDRKLRVLGVNAAHVPEALDGLERVMGTRALALDKRLITGMDALVRRLGGPPALLRQTDAQGPEGPGWPNLQHVAKQAGAALLAELFPNPAPLLLVQLGLLARYDLRELIAGIVAAAADDRSHAIVLLNPLHEGEAPERIANRLTIPSLLPGQVAMIPREWSRNEHRRAHAS